MRVVNIRRRWPELLMLGTGVALALVLLVRGARLPAAAMAVGMLLGVATLKVLRRRRASRSRALATRRSGRAREYVVPAELPPPYGALIGRDDEMSRVTSYLTSVVKGVTGPKVVAVTGPAGVGKSAFAVEIAHRLAERYPDGQLLVRLDPELGRDTRYALSTLVAALSRHDERVPEAQRESWYRERTRCLRMLTIIDHAGDLDVIGRLLPSGPGCAVIITSRDPLPDLPEGHLHVPLGPLGRTDSVEVLATLIGKDRVYSELEHAEQIVDASAGYPAALDIAGAVLARRAAWKLEIAVTRMTQLPSPPSDDPELPPFTRVLDLAFALLTEREQTGLRLLGVLQSRRVAPWMLSALFQGVEQFGSESDRAVAGRVLDRLAHARLTERRVDDETGALVFRVPRYVQAYARLRAHELDDATRAAATERLVEERRSRGGQAPEAFLRRTVYRHLDAGQLSLALERAREAAQLSWDLRTAGRDRAVERSRVAAEEGLTLAALAEVYAELGWIEEGLAAVASALEQGKDSSRSRPRALRVKGALRRRQRRIDEAEQHLSEALAAAERIEDRTEQVRVLRELVLARALSREPGRGIEAVGRAEALCQQLGDSGLKARPSVWYARGGCWRRASAGAMQTRYYGRRARCQPTVGWDNSCGARGSGTNGPTSPTGKDCTSVAGSRLCPPWRDSPRSATGTASRTADSSSDVPILPRRSWTVPRRSWRRRTGLSNGVVIGGPRRTRRCISPRRTFCTAEDEMRWICSTKPSRPSPSWATSPVRREQLVCCGRSSRSCRQNRPLLAWAHCATVPVRSLVDSWGCGSAHDATARRPHRVVALEAAPVPGAWAGQVGAGRRLGHGGGAQHGVRGCSQRIPNGGGDPGRSVDLSRHTARGESERQREQGPAIPAARLGPSAPDRRGRARTLPPQGGHRAGGCRGDVRQGTATPPADTLVVAVAATRRSHAAPRRRVVSWPGRRHTGASRATQRAA